MVVQVWFMATIWRSGLRRAARRTLRPGGQVLVSLWSIHSWMVTGVDGTYAAEAVDAYLADGRLRREGGVREVIDGGCHCLL
jgi:hypothetical protein